MIPALKKISSELKGSPSNPDIWASRENVQILAEQAFGRESAHYKNLVAAYKLTPTVQKEVVLGEIDAMISELETGPSEKPLKSEMNRPVDSASSRSFAGAPSNLALQVPALKVPAIEKKDLKRVFIVHGHDEEMKQAVARVISDLDLKPIILHEQPSKGKTVMGKLQIYAEDVDFAVILISPDDLCEGKHRARQNVIMELGYFLGRLGPERVFTLFRESDDFEFPTDYLGVVYIPYDSKGSWKYKMADEMKAIDPKIDKNKL